MWTNNEENDRKNPSLCFFKMNLIKPNELQPRQFFHTKDVAIGDILHSPHLRRHAQNTSCLTSLAHHRKGEYFEKVKNKDCLHE